MFVGFWLGKREILILICINWYADIKRNAKTLRFLSDKLSKVYNVIQAFAQQKNKIK